MKRKAIDRSLRKDLEAMDLNPLVHAHAHAAIVAPFDLPT